METPPAAGHGFLEALRALGDSLLASARDRIELIAIEVQEEKFRLIRIFIWISGVVFAGMMAATFVTLTLVYLFWDDARLAVLIGFAVLYTGVLIGLMMAFRRFLARQPRPFAATLEEIAEDRACMPPRN
jgi:uncharacterized membrane protein YqjE